MFRSFHFSDFYLSIYFINFYSPFYNRDDFQEKKIVKLQQRAI